MSDTRTQRMAGHADEHAEWRVLLVVAVGGVLGAWARYGLDVALPTFAVQWSWATMLVNASGCLLIGVLMAWVETGRAPRLARPFLGVGVLGGYTTFSTYAVQVSELWADGRVELGVLYLVVTPVLALVCVAVGAGAARRLIGTRLGLDEVTP